MFLEVYVAFQSKSKDSQLYCLYILPCESMGFLPILSSRGRTTKIYYIISDFRMVTIFEKNT